LKDRWFTVLAAAVLALGIGANNAVFTLVNAVLLRDLPFDHPGQIVRVTTRDTRGRQTGISLADFEDWRRSAHTFSALCFVWSGSFNVSDEGRIPEQYPGAYVSASFFKMLRVAPVIGRDFGPEDDGPGGPPVVMLGNSLWKQRYGGDRAVLGRVIRLNGVAATVIGVMPDGMQFPNNDEIWLPSSQIPPTIRRLPRQARNYIGIGRLRDGITPDQAGAELRTIGAQLSRQYPDTNKDVAPYAEPFAQTVTGSQLKLVFWSLMGAVAFVLLIACANVANLLLARAANRSNEISVRVALGATRWQVIRQLLIESLLLAFTAGALGLLLSIGGIRWFDAQTQTVGKPYWMVFAMDWRTFAFLLGICVATGLVFGLAPALHVSRTNVSETLKEGGRTGSSGVRARRWTTTLVMAEVALTLVLLAGAGFMMRSFLAAYSTDVGLDTSRLLTMQMILPNRKYPAQADRVRFLQQIDERLSATAGVAAVSTASNTPAGGGAELRVEVEGARSGESDRRAVVTMVSVGTRYFDALGLPVRGRAFTELDGEPGREVAVVNQRFVDTYFGGRNPIDRRIRLVQNGPSASAAPQPPWLTIVGVVPDVRQRSTQDNRTDPVAYTPHPQNADMTGTPVLLARTPGEPAGASQALREAIRAVDPDMALYNVRTMDELLAQQRWPFRIFGTMFSVFALIALVLSAVGLYGVTAYSVTQHTREIGVRMVLGAEPGQVVWLFLRRGLLQLGVGLAIGVLGAFGVGQLLQSLLVGTSPRDPITLGSIVAILVLVGAAACFWPARRATRLDPVVALRCE
ncbi:MAG TPA: ABC transporter permease, partial [Vicinamibacterales bacterium]|nr:ABC transporter permease [Vicinamibacterales bacterium]